MKAKNSWYKGDNIPGKQKLLYLIQQDCLSIEKSVIKLEKKCIRVLIYFLNEKNFLIIILTLFKINFLLAENIEIINDTKGDGLKVVNHSWVKIEYTGSFEDGTVFDTNVGKDKPLVFQIGMKEVIPGFEQGIIGTNKGSKRKIKIPAQLAYGKKGAGELIPPNSNLIFEFKILDVLSPNYEKINNEKLEKLIKENAVALDIRLDNQWKKTGVIKGSFQETAFDINGKFNVYLMDKVRALAGAESQGIELIFISHDGKLKF